MKRILKIAGWLILGYLVFLIGVLMVAGIRERRANLPARQSPAAATATAFSSVTRRPSATATRAATAAALPPTATPLPAATPTPTATQFVAPAPLVFSGIGNHISEDFQIVNRLNIAKVSYTGEGHAAIEIKNSATGEMKGLPLNTIDSYSGVSVVDMRESGSYYLEVEAEGNWSLELSHVLGLDQIGTPPLEFAGSGDAVTGIFRMKAARADVVASHDGAKNFAVQMYSVNRERMAELPANEIGPVNDLRSTFAARDEYYFVAVTAEGNWSVSITQ